MSEELQVQQVEQSGVIETQQVEEGTQQASDPYESEAREQGWIPKEEYQGDPDKWKPAKEFVERGELFGKIDHLGRELKETKKALKMLQEHHTKVKEVEYSRAVNELKTLQKKYLEEGNSDSYLETTELLTDLKAEQKVREVAKEMAPNQPDPRFVAWVDTNKWYQKDSDMRKFADVVGMEYAQANPNLDPEEVLGFVTKKVRATFPQKFTNPNREKPSVVEGANTATPKNKGSFELTDDERKVMNTFVRSGVMKADEYIAQVKAMRG